MAGNGNVHVPRMVITAAMLNIRLQLPEVTLLDGLQGISNTVKFFVLRRMLSDVPGGTRLIAIVTLEAGTVTLATETGEPDTDLLAISAAGELGYLSPKADSEDITNQREVFVNVAVPVILQSPFAVPVASVLAG